MTKNDTRTLTPMVFLKVFIFVILMPLLPLLIPWRWDWWQAWLYAAIYIGGFAVSRWLAARSHPDLLAERARMTQHADMEPWDRCLSPLIGLGGAAIPLVAGLDALFKWAPDFTLSVQILGLILILLGTVLCSLALIANRYFSGVVRIQQDRGHQVVSGGPYRWVRHPGYAGAILMYLGTPLLLDALWAYLPVVFMIVVLVIRTRLEDLTLQSRLVGYTDYAQRVRYRLLPGVW